MKRQKKKKWHIERVPIRLVNSSDSYSIDGLCYGNSGLAVTPKNLHFARREFAERGQWRITVLSVGFGFGNFSTREKAKIALRAVADLTDWNAMTYEVANESKHLKQSIKLRCKLVTQYGTKWHLELIKLRLTGEEFLYK